MRPRRRHRSHTSKTMSPIMTIRTNRVNQRHRQHRTPNRNDRRHTPNGSQNKQHFSIKPVTVRGPSHSSRSRRRYTPERVTSRPHPGQAHLWGIRNRQRSRSNHRPRRRSTSSHRHRSVNRSRANGNKVKPRTMNNIRSPRRHVRPNPHHSHHSRRQSNQNPTRLNTPTQNRYISLNIRSINHLNKRRLIGVTIMFLSSHKIRPRTPRNSRNHGTQGRHRRHVRHRTHNSRTRISLIRPFRRNKSRLPSITRKPSRNIAVPYKANLNGYNHSKPLPSQLDQKRPSDTAEPRSNPTTKREPHKPTPQPTANKATTPQSTTNKSTAHLSHQRHYPSSHKLTPPTPNQTNNHQSTQSEPQPRTHYPTTPHTKYNPDYQYQDNNATHPT